MSFLAVFFSTFPQNMSSGTGCDDLMRDQSPTHLYPAQPPTIPSPTRQLKVSANEEVLKGSFEGVDCGSTYAGGGGDFAPCEHHTEAPTQQADEKADERIAQQQMPLGKVAYFTMFLGLSAIQPYYSVFLASRGLTASHIGAVLMVIPLSVLFLVPALAYIADRYHISRSILTTWSLGAAVCIVSAAGLTPEASQEAATPANKVIISVLMVMHGILLSPCVAFVDHQTMGLLPASKKTSWGKMRVFGAYSWMWGAPACAVVSHYMGYFASFLVYLFGTVAMLAVVLRGKSVNEEKTTLQFIDVLKFLCEKKQRRLSLFLAATSIMGAGYAIVATYLFLFLQQDLGAPEILLGLSITCTVLVEIPLFRASEAMHARFTDQQMLIGAMVAWVVRVTGYSLLQNPWVVLLLEPLHGLTFGLMWLGGVHYVSHAFPKDLAASAMGSINASAFGLGPAIGTLVGGLCYEALGARLFFRYAAVGMGCSAVGFYFIDKQWDDGKPTAEVVTPSSSDAPVVENGVKPPQSTDPDAPNFTLPLWKYVREDPRRLYDLKGNGGLDQALAV